MDDLAHSSQRPPASRRFREPIEYDPVGTATRVGVIVPFDFGLDWEYWGYLPAEVELYFTRTPYLNKTVGIPLARSVGSEAVVRRAARSLATLDPGVTVYACSSGSFVNGLSGEARLRQAMLEAGARAAVTSSGALLDALGALGARKVAVASPYDRRLSNLLVDFLGQAGHETVAVTHLGMRQHISQVSKRTIASLIREASHRDADVVFLSCTALRTRGIIAEMEQEIGKPILTSNQVTLWAALAAVDALPTDPTSEVRGWVLGGGDPMAESTAILLQHTADDQEHTIAADQRASH